MRFSTFQLDILVNNAGRSQRAKWDSIEIAVDKEMFDLNVFSIVSLSRLAVKHFLKVGGGQIVNTSSLAGILPVPMSATYCGTKHALHVSIFKRSFPFVMYNYSQFRQIFYTIARISDIIYYYILLYTVICYYILLYTIILYTFAGLFQTVVHGISR